MVSHPNLQLVKVYHLVAGFVNNKIHRIEKIETIIEAFGKNRFKLTLRTYL